MHLVTFAANGGAPRVGALIDQQYVVDLNRADAQIPADMLAFLAAGEPVMARARSVATQPGGERLAPAEVKLLAPIPRPGKMVCLGHNYHDHLGAGKTQPAEYPTIFGKTSNTVIGPGQAIVIPAAAQQVDYEAELAVVIGRTARRVSEGEALRYVVGYTIFNDVSSREYQKRTSQWMLGKCVDTFGPMGPALVTADEIPDPHCLELALTLNGMELQRTNTRNMIFSIPFLIAYLSAVMTLEPGDLIVTGTPAKTELAKSIPPFMHAGDVVAVTIEGLGRLENPVIAE